MASAEAESTDAAGERRHRFDRRLGRRAHSHFAARRVVYKLGTTRRFRVFCWSPKLKLTSRTPQHAEMSQAAQISRSEQRAVASAEGRREAPATEVVAGGRGEYVHCSPKMGMEAPACTVVAANGRDAVTDEPGCDLRVERGLSGCTSRVCEVRGV